MDKRTSREGSATPRDTTLADALFPKPAVLLQSEMPRPPLSGAKESHTLDRLDCCSVGQGEGNILHGAHTTHVCSHCARRRFLNLGRKRTEGQKADAKTAHRRHETTTRDCTQYIIAQSIHNTVHKWNGAALARQEKERTVFHSVWCAAMLQQATTRINERTHARTWLTPAGCLVALLLFARTHTQTPSRIL